MSQTWNVTFLAPVAGAGVGDNTSSGVGAGGAPQTWNVALFTGAASATGAGNTTSAGVGAASTAAQVWHVTLLDGSTVGGGNTLSEGRGVATATALTWYYLRGLVTGVTVSADGAGDTLSEGAGSPVVGTAPGGFGETFSAGAGDVDRVIPAGVATLGPYWAPGELVTAYRVREWRGAIAARLNAGPGPVVATTLALPDATVEFVGLADDSYIAVGAEGQRRYFMVGQP